MNVSEERLSERVCRYPCSEDSSRHKDYYKDVQKTHSSSKTEETVAGPGWPSCAPGEFPVCWPADGFISVCHHTRLVARTYTSTQHQHND